MRRYYLGLNAHGPRASQALFTHGSAKDVRELNECLAKRYGGAPMLCKNGRSALTIALKSYLDSGDRIIICGFTCHAVYEAVLAAGMTPVFADISEGNLNFNVDILEKLWRKYSKFTSKIKGIVVQNTLGNAVDMEAIEKFAKKYKLVMIEDLAHSAGVKYPDRREAGTVGSAAVLSFGKDKSINAISGGAVVLRDPCKHVIEAPLKVPRTSDVLRARFYPLLCAICRGLTGVHLGGALMRFFQKIHWVERSADSRLDLKRRMPKYQAKLALPQFKNFHPRGEGVLREFVLVRDREEVLEKLRENGYYFDALWYEKPISPARYYDEVKFPEKECPTAVKVAAEIVNFPTYYGREELKKAREIVKPYLVGVGNE